MGLLRDKRFFSTCVRKQAPGEATQPRSDKKDLKPALKHSA